LECERDGRLAVAAVGVRGFARFRWRNLRGAGARPSERESEAESDYREPTRRAQQTVTTEWLGLWSVSEIVRSPATEAGSLYTKPEPAIGRENAQKNGPKSRPKNGAEFGV